MTFTTKRKNVSLQWHLTAECDQNCAHCYVTDNRTYRQELENTLTLDECIAVIDSHTRFAEKLGATPNLVLTGGDPLLRRDFFDIAGYAQEKGSTISVLGNPYHLNENNLAKLKTLGIKSYQISIDGLRKTHDDYRKRGSFDASVRAIEELKNTGIRTVVMYSISRQNAKDLIPVMQLASDLQVNAFAFARVCGYGNGKQLDPFTPLEYRDLLLQAYDKEKQLISGGSKTTFTKKDHLWTLLLKELEEISCEPTPDGLIYGGCSIGVHGLCILADGTAFACRRFYSPIGKVPEQSIEEIFLSDEMNKYRNANYENCSRCDLSQYCRGCPAVAYNETGIFGSPDPQCWRKFEYSKFP